MEDSIEEPETEGNFFYRKRVDPNLVAAWHASRLCFIKNGLWTKNVDSCPTTTNTRGYRVKVKHLLKAKQKVSTSLRKNGEEESRKKKKNLIFGKVYK